MARKATKPGHGHVGQAPESLPDVQVQAPPAQARERIKDYLLMEQEFIRNQEVFKPHEEKDKEERDKMEDKSRWPSGSRR